MLDRLQKKWKVNGLRLLLILVTFAVGGSLTGIAGKNIMSLTAIKNAWIYVPVYILLVTIIWPVIVILVSIPLGQFIFFKNYIKKIGGRMGLTKRVKGSQFKVNSHLPDGGSQKPEVRKRSIAIFASGTGSNAEKIIQYFTALAASAYNNKPVIKVALIVCNNPGAGVLKIAENYSIPALLIEKKRFYNGDGYLQNLKIANIDLIVLAGFLWKIPQKLLEAYPRQIINLHPALLPDYGGAGMYGNNVHEAVVKAKEPESGITIHYVDEQYDNGDIIFQKKCAVFTNDTFETLAHRVHKLEHEYYAPVIEKLLEVKNIRHLD
jgi:formyltetrahydrofolate-dependent phosphoribosylglycinamide formyltransferase